jgi:hypothetical protein
MMFLFVHKTVNATRWIRETVDVGLIGPTSTPVYYVPIIFFFFYLAFTTHLRV